MSSSKWGFRKNNRGKGNVRQGIWTKRLHRNISGIQGYSAHTPTCLRNLRFTGSPYRRKVLQLRACQGYRFPQTEFEIDKIVRTRNKICIKQHLVKWRGYDETFNSWVNSSDIKKI